MGKKKIAVIVGSLREGSFNKKLALQALKMQPESLELEIVEIGNLVHYNEDLDHDNPPAEWVEFRKKIKEADGYLFFTPEYNRSIPGVLKNAIDVGSRPYGYNNWGGKPGAVVSSSISALGGEAANHVFRQPMVFVNVYMMQQPEAYIGNTMTLFDEQGEFANAESKSFFQNWLKAFEDWVNKF
jgi:chromate reductase